MIGWQLVARAESITTSPYVISTGIGRYVAYRTASGAIRAFVDRCPHRGASFKTGWLDDECLRCPYHGWGFDAEGHCVDIPADAAGTRVPTAARLQSVAIIEQDGFIWLSADDDQQRAPRPSGLIESLSGMQLLASGQQQVAAAFGHVTEAFTELPYLPSFCATHRLRLDEESVQRKDHSLSASYRICETNSAHQTTPRGLKPLKLQRFSFEIFLPSTVICKLSLDGPLNDICVVVSNLKQSSQTTSVHWFVLAEPRGKQLPLKRIEAVMDAIFSDFALTVETLHSSPLDSTEVSESHVSTDLIVDAYRRALANFTALSN